MRRKTVSEGGMSALISGIGNRHENQNRPTAIVSEVLEPRTLFAAINPSVVDLFMGYTAADVAQVGSAQLMVDKINRGVQLMNQTLANSKVAASIRLVGTLQTNYVESGNGNTDLAHLDTPSDPQMADLKAAAAKAGADLIDVTVTTMAGLGGITQGNYNVILLDFLDNGVLSHELGHSFGGGHPHSQDSGNAPAAYESELTYNGANYAGAIGGNLNYFSNPNVFFYGQSTGIGGFGATAANNALAMNAKAPSLAAISSTLTPDTTGPTAELGSIWTPNQAATTGNTLLSRAGWVMSTNATTTEPGSNAIDGDLTTRFSTDAFQAAGQYLQADLGSAQSFNTITLDTGAASTGDYPRGYSVYVSNTGTDWTTQPAIATGAGSSETTPISFNQVNARYVRIVQTGSASSNYWSVAELNIGTTTAAAAGTIKFQVVYTDGSGVSVASFGNNNVTVTGPNGFSAAATFTGVDDPSVNYGYHVVTYSVTTPGAVGALSGYTFSMNGNSVADTVGNFTPAGVIGGPSPLSPDYAGADFTHAAEIGDLAGQTWQITDEIGQKYQGIYFDPANYHFTVSQDTTLTINAPATTTSGVPLQVAIAQDTNNNLVEDNGERLTPTAPNVWNLKAGNNYYLEFTAYQPGLIPYGMFTASVTSNLTVTKPATGSISGSIFNDSNSNGVRDAGEPAIPLAAVQLTGTDTSGKAVSLFAYTDATGNYIFNNVAPSSAAGYTLTEFPVYSGTATLPQGTNIAGNLGGTAAGASISGVVLQPGAAGTGYLFSDRPLASLVMTTLSGRVYLDPTGQGKATDPNDVAIPNVMLTLTGNDANGVAVNLAATSDANGNYIFANVPQSDPTNGFTLTIIQPTTTQLSQIVIGNLNAAGVLPTSLTGIIFNGVAGTGYDFPQSALTAAAPAAANQTVNGAQNGTVNGTVTGAATASVVRAALADAAGTASLEAVLVPGSGPSHALSFTLNSNGTFTYVPVKNFFGTDSFQYELVSSDGAASVATETINVAHVNQPPTFSTELDGPIFTSARTAVTIDLQERVADIDTGKMKFRITKVTGGKAKLLKNGMILYTPNPRFYGAAGVTFKATDGKATATLTQGVCVCQVDVGPTAKNDEAVSHGATGVTVNALANDTSSIGGSLEIVTVNPPQHGTATVVKIGSKDRIHYTPVAGFTGTDTFQYEIMDLAGKTSVATITLEVHQPRGSENADA